MKAGAFFPLGAAVSRRTGGIRLEWGEDEQAQIRFGKVMNRIGEEALRTEDAERKASYQESRREAEA